MAEVSARLNAYLVLERQMLALDEKGDPLADALRDAMDPIWHSLTKDEHELLNERSIVGAVEPRGSPPWLALALDTKALVVPPVDPEVERTSNPIHADDWRCAA